jgi:hypothetical protein
MWQAVVDALFQQPQGAVARIPASQIWHPVSAGMRQTVAFPVGQRATYAIPLTDTWSLHVDDFGEHYDARLSICVTPAPAEPSIPRTPVNNGVLVQRQAGTATPARGAAPARPHSGGIEQAIKESPGTTLLVTTALGALFGALGGSKNSAMTGALVGGVAGLAAVSVATEEDPSKKAEMSVELAQMMAKLLSENRGSSSSRRPALDSRDAETTQKLLPPQAEATGRVKLTKAQSGRGKKKPESSTEKARPGRRKPKA